MNKTKIKKIIKDDLSPRYEQSKDSLIEYISYNRNRLEKLRQDFKKQKQKIDGVENPIWRNHYNGFYGHYDTKLHKQIPGNYYDGIAKKNLKYIQMDKKDAETIIEKEHKENLKNLVQTITDEIMEFKPKNVESGYTSEHDIHFIITTKDTVRLSYTINTIIAGGYVQVLHYRTLRKLHKGLI